MAKDKELLNSLLKPDESDTDKIINSLTPEENKIALELLEEKIDGTDTDTPPKVMTEGTEEETETPPDEDEGEEKVIVPDDDEDEDEDDFTLSEDFISQQPEEVQGILGKYKDKNKEDIAQAVANAIVMKSPYLKDDEEMTNQIKEKFLKVDDSELVNILIKTQKESGRSEDIQTSKEAEKPAKIMLPEIPEDDPGIKKILEQETLKRLKAKYPDMPDVDSLDNVEYKEWRRDLDADDPDNEFRTQKTQTEKVVKDELSKLIYIQKELPNLYDESPQEIIPLLTEENLPRLKSLNNDPMSVLLQDIQGEIELIRIGLKKYGITEKELSIDFTIVKDEKGMPFNSILNDLITEGVDADGKAVPSSRIIGSRGKTFWLKKGELAKKFREEYDDKILTAFFDHKTRTDKLHKGKLKEETLREATGSGQGRTKALSVEDIEKENNPERIKQILADLEKV